VRAVRAARRLKDKRLEELLRQVAGAELGAAEKSGAELRGRESIRIR
jgi:hypothetical protein